MTKKPKWRHWLALGLALATTILAVLSFADFSGEPPPRWREVGMLVGPGLTLAAITLNLFLDGKDPQSPGQGGNS